MSAALAPAAIPAVYCFTACNSRKLPFNPRKVSTSVFRGPKWVSAPGLRQVRQGLSGTGGKHVHGAPMNNCFATALVRLRSDQSITFNFQFTGYRALKSRVPRRSKHNFIRRRILYHEEKALSLSIPNANYFRFTYATYLAVGTFLCRVTLFELQFD